MGTCVCSDEVIAFGISSGGGLAVGIQGVNIDTEESLPDFVVIRGLGLDVWREFVMSRIRDEGTLSLFVSLVNGVWLVVAAGEFGVGVVGSQFVVSGEMESGETVMHISFKPFHLYLFYSLPLYQSLAHLKFLFIYFIFFPLSHGLSNYVSPPLSF